MFIFIGGAAEAPDAAASAAIFSTAANQSSDKNSYDMQSPIPQFGRPTRHERRRRCQNDRRRDLRRFTPGFRPPIGQVPSLSVIRRVVTLPFLVVVGWALMAWNAPPALAQCQHFSVSADPRFVNEGQ